MIVTWQVIEHSAAQSFQLEVGHEDEEFKPHYHQVAIVGPLSNKPNYGNEGFKFRFKTIQIIFIISINNKLFIIITISLIIKMLS